MCSIALGSNVPFQCTASGKTFMSSLSLPKRRAFVSTLSLKPLTLRTQTDPSASLRELNEIAERGYALDDEEFVEGMAAIAVPVRDPPNRFIAAFAFHGPVQRVSVESAIEKKDVLARGAERLAHALFSDAT